jgi:hypothetical protein
VRKPPKRYLAFVGGVTCLGVVGTSWASGWVGSGVAGTTGEIATVADLSARVTVDGELYPGVTLTAVAKVSNPNEFAVTPVRIVDLVVSAMKDGRYNDLCNATTSKIVAGISDTTITAGTVDQELTIPVSMGLGASGACAGSTIQLRFRITGDAAPRAATAG